MELGHFRTDVRDIWEELEEIPETLFAVGQTPESAQVF